MGKDGVGTERKISAASMRPRLGGGLNIVDVEERSVGEAGRGGRRWVATWLVSSRRVYRMPSERSSQYIL